MVTSYTFLAILIRHMYHAIAITRSGQMVFILYLCNTYDNFVSITITLLVICFTILFISLGSFYKTWVLQLDPFYLCISIDYTKNIFTVQVFFKHPPKSSRQKESRNMMIVTIKRGSMKFLCNVATGKKEKIEKIPSN